MGRHLRQVTSLFRISPRDVCFIAISIAFMQLFPVPQEHPPCRAEQWLNSRANRVVARVVVETFGGCSTPPTRSRARLAGTDVVEFLRETDDGEVRRSMLAFGTDVLFGIGVRVWFVFTLFILIYGIAGGGLGIRILAIGASALGYCLCFALRGAALGIVAASVDLVPLIRFVDPPLRIVVLLSAILSVVLALAMALRIRDGFGRNAAKGLSAALVLALPWVVAGCKDGFSNNSITINVSGGEGFMPYLAMVALVVWQQYRERRRRRDGPELPRVRVASVEEGAAGEIARGIVPYLGGRPKKGRQPAFTQKAVAVLCGKDVNTVARWESGAIKPPLDYTAELRVKGGIAFFDWVREYNAHNGVADIFVQIQKGNVVYTEGLTEREKGLVEEYIQELRQG